MNYFENSQNKEEYRNGVLHVLPVLNKSEINNYSQLSCVFCQKGIMENDWKQDNFTWGKPAHKFCYDEKKSQLANQDTKEFS